MWTVRARGPVYFVFWIVTLFVYSQKPDSIGYVVALKETEVQNSLTEKRSKRYMRKLRNIFFRLFCVVQQKTGGVYIYIYLFVGDSPFSSNKGTDS